MRVESRELRVLKVLRALRVQGPGFIPSVVDVDVVVDVVVDVAGQKILLRVHHNSRCGTNPNLP